MSPPQQWGGGGGFGPPGDGGGGFGPPGGGGGGFGPPGGGGGGFGPPAGGGFGPPAGGGGGFSPTSGGGGFSPPPGGGGYGGGGDGPLGRIPFTPDDERNIQQTALFMKIAGGLALLSSLFSIVGSIGVGLARSAPIAGAICSGVIGLAVQALLAVLLFMASGAFEKIVSTDGSDQQHLAEGLKKLRVYFVVKAVLWILGLILCCCGLAFALTLGVAAFGALADLPSQ